MDEDWHFKSTALDIKVRNSILNYFQFLILLFYCL